MEVLSAIPVVGDTLAIIVPFLIVLSVVVFVHEYGHYIVGRWCGIRAEVFSVGFGKRLFGWTDKRGTRWQIAALPLGGYVKFVGDMDPASAGKVGEDGLTREERTEAFHMAALWRRAATVAAGPVFNFLLSIVLFAGLSLAIGKDSNEPVIADVRAEAISDVGFQAGDRVLEVAGEPVDTFAGMLDILHKTDGEPVSAVVERDGDVRDITVRYETAPRVDAITPGMAAAQAGILPGDLIKSIGGEEVHSFYDLQVVAAGLPTDQPVDVVVLRDGKERTFTFTPDVVERRNPVTGEVEPLPTFGIRSQGFGGLEATKEAVLPHEAVAYGAQQTWMIISGTVTYLSDMIFANADTSQLGGPIRIAEISGEKAEQGASELIWLIAMLSTSIGLLNLFPIPVLDGGHLMFYAVEALRGRPLNDSWMQVGNMIGLSLVLFLMVFATYNDLARFWAG